MAIKCTVFCFFFQYYANNCLLIWPFFSIIHKGISANQQNGNTCSEGYSISDGLTGHWLPFSNDIQVTSYCRETEFLKSAIMYQKFQFCQIMSQSQCTLSSQNIKTALSFVVVHRREDCKGPFHYKVFKTFVSCESQKPLKEGKNTI